MQGWHRAMSDSVEELVVLLGFAFEKVVCRSWGTGNETACHSRRFAGVLELLLLHPALDSLGQLRQRSEARQLRLAGLDDGPFLRPHPLDLLIHSAQLRHGPDEVDVVVQSHHLDFGIDRSRRLQVISHREVEQRHAERTALLCALAGDQHGLDLLATSRTIRDGLP